ISLFPQMDEVELAAAYDYAIKKDYLPLVEMLYAPVKEGIDEDIMFKDDVDEALEYNSQRVLRWLFQLPLQKFYASYLFHYLRNNKTKPEILQLLVSRVTGEDLKSTNYWALQAAAEYNPAILQELLAK